MQLSLSRYKSNSLKSYTKKSSILNFKRKKAHNLCFNYYLNSFIKSLYGRKKFLNTKQFLLEYSNFFLPFFFLFVNLNSQLFMVIYLFLFLIKIVTIFKSKYIFSKSLFKIVILINTLLI